MRIAPPIASNLTKMSLNVHTDKVSPINKHNQPTLSTIKSIGKPNTKTKLFR